MKSYVLDTILSEFINKKEIQHQKILFVLPSKRSAYYAKEKLKTLVKEKNLTLASPDFLTPNELVEKITQLIVLNSVDLIYYLYLSYQKKYQPADDYALFSKWAPMLLNDFNDVVTFLPNNTEKQKNIFTNLKDIKEIENWSLNKKDLSEHQQRYLDLMGKFYEILMDFNNTLLENGFAYSGLNYQKAIEILSENDAIKNHLYLKNIQQINFVGLYAITPAEKIIYQALKKGGIKTEFYWDADIYYLKQHHEVYDLFNKNFEDFRGKERIPQVSKFDESKKIHIITTSSEVEEAMTLKKFLNELRRENNELNNTAIILNKPENLELVLSAIPEGVEYNVTMEYPLSRTNAFHFLLQAMKIFVSIQDNKIYYKPLVAILINPFFKNYCKVVHDVPNYLLHKILNNIQNQNKIFIQVNTDNIFNNNFYTEEEQTSIEKIKNIFNVFTHSNNKDFIYALKNIFEEYIQKMLSEKIHDYININIAQSILEQLNRVYNVLTEDENDVFKTKKDVYVLVNQIISRESVSFKGEPMKGLQILGALESRLLDFENIFIPFMNEGVFPPDNRKISFFPYDLRGFFGLPLHYYDDAIFSYLFYRNLQHSKNIYLSYNASITENKKLRGISGEESRYIQQVKYELVPSKQNIQLFTYNIQYQPLQLRNNEIKINKTEEVINQLMYFTFSPSSITTYLDCSLKFYFRYILGLKPIGDVSEEMEANVEGTILHEVMRQLFNHQDVLDEKRILKVNEIEKLLKSNLIDRIVTEQIQKSNFELKGKTLIQKEILVEDIKTLMRKEIEYIRKNNLQLTIVHTEEEEEKREEMEEVQLELGNYSVAISGFPDRIDYDMIKKVFRIIDYKSSLSDYDILDYNKVGDESLLRFKNKSTKSINKQLQLLIYIYYANKKGMLKINGKTLENTNVTGIIVPLKNKLKENKSIYQEIQNWKNDFKNLTLKLQEIFNNYILNKEEPFQQTPNENLCAYCDFNYICKR
ncbi:MAG: PD-(D/E)XK nuclease family protein [Bacteroidota bacterium]